MLLLWVLPLTVFAQKLGTNKTVYLTDSKETIIGNTYTVKHGIGVAASMISAPVGLSYQYTFSPISRIEATAFFYQYSDNSGNRDNADYNDNYEDDRGFGSIGLEYHHLLAGRRYGKLFVMAGGGYNFEESDYSWLYEKKKKNRGFFLGSGVVIEGYTKSMNLTFNLDLGIAYHHTNKLIGTEGEGVDRYFGIAVGGGIYYNF